METNNELRDEEIEWKDSYKGKLWSTAVQKCFEAPFVEVAIQHMFFKIDEIHKKEMADLLHSHTEEMAKKVEGLKKDNKDWTVNYELSEREIGFNEGIDASLTIIREQTKG